METHENTAMLEAAEQLKVMSLDDSASNEDLPCAGECTCSHEETPEEAAEHLQFLTLVRQVLDQQTDALYKQYAKEQHPKDTDKQKSLMLEMQEQYFNHYMCEIYRYQVIHQQKQLDQMKAVRSTEQKPEGHSDTSFSDLVGGLTSSDESTGPLPLIPATIWTRQNIADFKQEILATQRECCIKISSLATATIRVPTHPKGTSIVWEFATDHYDLGFGLYFEWDLEPQESITMNISESSDEEEEDDDDEREDTDGSTVHDDCPTTSSGLEDQRNSSAKSLDSDTRDLEGGGSRGRRSAPRLPTDELIPIYRRDCHTDVYCGRHNYPGVGVYVFKFDNSFSLWRSKWLYYRIYYSH